jgi:hypothetical protein
MFENIANTGLTVVAIFIAMIIGIVIAGAVMARLSKRT